MQMANAKKGGTPVALTNGRSTPGSLKRGPGRPPKKVGPWTCSTLLTSAGRSCTRGNLSLQGTPMPPELCLNKEFRLNIMQSSLSFVLMASNAVTSSLNFSRDKYAFVTAASKQFEHCKQWHNRARCLCYGSFMRTGCLQYPCTNETQSFCTSK